MKPSGAKNLGLMILSAGISDVLILAPRGVLVGVAKTLFGPSLVTSGRKEQTLLGFGSPGCAGDTVGMVTSEC